MHAPDCALTMYGHLDPATLKAPLVCDGDCEDGGIEGDDCPPELEEVEPSNIRPITRGPTVTLTGDAARAYKQLATAETQLKAAQKRKDEALAAFLGAVTG